MLGRIPLRKQKIQLEIYFFRVLLDTSYITIQMTIPYPFFTLLNSLYNSHHIHVNLYIQYRQNVKSSVILPTCTFSSSYLTQ